MEIQFHEATPVEFPSKCACCLQPTSDTRLSYRHTINVGLLGTETKTRKLPVPYCKTCRDHVDWSEGGSWFGLLLSIPVNAFFAGLVTAMVVMVWRLSFDWAYEREELTGQIGVAVVVVVAAFLAWRRLSKRPGKNIRGRHARRGESFEIFSYKGGGTLKARIYNAEWAEMLLKMNPRLVRLR